MISFYFVFCTDIIHDHRGFLTEVSVEAVNGDIFIDFGCCISRRARLLNSLSLLLSLFVPSNSCRISLIRSQFALITLLLTSPELLSSERSKNMALIQDWLPPSRENYDLVLFLWQWYPLVRCPLVPSNAAGEMYID